MNRVIPYSRQAIDEDDIKAVVDVLRSNFLTQGPKVKEFETALAAYCDTGHAVAFSSGTAALHAAYFAAGIGRGDEIITTPITFAATANAALYLGARPVFVDVEPDTGNINPGLIEKAITEKTRAIVPVHYAGHPADLDPIHKIANKHNLLTIEDACHAVGASYKGRKIGSISDMAVFSFHPVKPITTGEGGAVTTGNRDFYDKLVMFREHGMTRDKSRFHSEPHGDWYYEMQFLGFNYRLTDIQSALGVSQLKKLDGFIEKRREISNIYRRAFSESDNFALLKENPGSSLHLFPVLLYNKLIKKKAEIFAELRKKGLGVQVHYIPVYLQHFYRSLGYTEDLFPVSSDFYRRQISIPLHHSMSNESVKHVVSVVMDTITD